MFRFKELIEEAKRTGCTCWTGYKRVPGTEPCESGSCIKESARGLWANIHAKQERIKNGSGERMRKPGSKGAPTDAALKASQTNEETEQIDEISGMTTRSYMQKARTQLSNIEVGRRSTGDKDFGAEKARRRANSLNKIADKTTSRAVRDQLHKATAFVKEEMSIDEQFDLIEEVIQELALINNIDSERIWETLEDVSDQELLEYAVDAKGYKSSTGGLTQKGRDAYNSKGAHLKAPVTTPPSKLKAGSKAANRRKSFCARMSGVDGPMRKPNGEPTRKALALRKWNC